MLSQINDHINLSSKRLFSSGVPFVWVTLLTMFLVMIFLSPRARDIQDEEDDDNVEAFLLIKGLNLSRL